MATKKKATKRKGLSKKARFEVFKRDSFTCQYCGKAAPDVILEVDHISPVSKGGGNDIMNLITSCRDCNAGKNDRELSDDSVVQRQRRQLEELNERREQLAMMLKWREGLGRLREQQVDAIEEAWLRLAGWGLSDQGRNNVAKWLKSWPLADILDAVETSATQYLERNSGGKVTSESFERAFLKVPGILRVREQPSYMQELFYVRGILRKRLRFVDEWRCIDLLKRAHAAGMDTFEMKARAREARSWDSFKFYIEQFIDAAEGNDG